eukprot:CAMPEP_0197904840 /NCGR_PEP_ID=MMETSP1439-20131203/58916_1 /TAXON_ID=66791 /ORGANISM="Gonyaulax spinifera, Strain CCMP409" /LENGTH=48 /DNA_ID= /DNA_START= /DNA_END= /DNA_ORIENTATION=
MAGFLQGAVVLRLFPKILQQVLELSRAGHQAQQDVVERAEARDVAGTA